MQMLGWLTAVRWEGLQLVQGVQGVQGAVDASFLESQGPRARVAPGVAGTVQAAVDRGGGPQRGQTAFPHPPVHGFPLMSWSLCVSLFLWAGLQRDLSSSSPKCTPNPLLCLQGEAVFTIGGTSV